MFDIDFGKIDKVLEGEFRPGHFKGMANVVHRFFEIIRPDVALFGLKDFQQYRIVKELVRLKNMPIEVLGAATMREASGLAMSSRNKRLSEDELNSALVIYHTMEKAKNWIKTMPASEVKLLAMKEFESVEGVDLEYFEIVNPDTFNTLSTTVSIDEKALALVSAFVGNVRLIDNELINP